MAWWSWSILLPRLSAREYLLVGRTAMLFLLALIAVRCCSLARLSRMLQWRVHRAHGAEPVAASHAERVAQLVAAVGRRMPGHPSCLHHALVLGWLLGGRGVQTAIRLGVVKSSRALRAHAWLETLPPAPPLRFFDDAEFLDLQPC